MQARRRGALVGIGLGAALAASIQGAGAQPQAKAPTVLVPVPATGTVTFARFALKAKAPLPKLPKLVLAGERPAGPVAVIGLLRRKPGTKNVLVGGVTVVNRAERTPAAGGPGQISVTVTGASSPVTLTGQPLVVQDALVFEERPPAFCSDEPRGGDAAAYALAVLLGSEEDRRLVRELAQAGLGGACDVPVSPEPAERIGALACRFTLRKTAPGAGAFEGSCDKETSSVTFGDVLAALLETASSGETACSVETILKRAHVICGGRTVPAELRIRVGITWRGKDPARPWVAASGVPKPGAPAPSIGPFTVSRVGF